MLCHEEYLINQMADLVYEIQNGFVVPCDFLKRELNQQDVLIFYQREECLPPFAQELVEVQNEREGIKRVVESEKTNEIIMSMIQNGWRLKEMYHEGR